jgi:hypothetical protein
MWIGKLHIVRSNVVHFQWLPHRLTARSNPAIYHWLWFSFAWHTSEHSIRPIEIPFLEEVISLIGNSV